MKYTLKQVMAFTAMTYENEISRVNGRNGYLITPTGQRVDELKQKPSSFTPVIIAFTGGVYLMASNAIMLFSNGYNTPSLLTCIAAFLMAAFAVNLFLKDLKLFAEFKKTMQGFALGHEPQDLWNFEYSQGSSEKARLVRSILGARMLYRKMIASTAIPLDNAVIDARAVHLVKELTASKDNEIHEAIMEEAGFFCRQAVTQMSFYAPLISFQDEIEKEFADKKKAA